MFENNRTGEWASEAAKPTFRRDVGAAVAVSSSYCAFSSLLFISGSAPIRRRAVDGAGQARPRLREMEGLGLPPSRYEDISRRLAGPVEQEVRDVRREDLRLLPRRLDRHRPPGVGGADHRRPLDVDHVAAGANPGLRRRFA